MFIPQTKFRCLDGFEKEVEKKAKQIKRRERETASFHGDALHIIASSPQ